MTKLLQSANVKDMSKNPVLNKLNNLILGLVVLVSFLTPIFFLPITNEYFEFNKLYFFIASTAVLALLWCTKMVVEKKVCVARSSVDFPLLLVLTSFILSTVTSLDKTSSLFGSYGRWFPSLFGFATLYFFYYAVSTNADSARKIRAVLYCLAGSSAVPSLFGLLNYFGLTLPFLNLFNQRGFLLSGSSAALSAVALTGTVVCALLAINVKSDIKKILFTAAFLIDFITIVIFGGAVFAGLAVAVIALAFISLPGDSWTKNKIYVFPVLGAIITFAALYFVVPQTKTMLQENYPKEVLPSINESWVISSTTLRDFPIFGSGISTFYLNYPRYKTVSQNYTPTWNVTFDKPANELFNIVSTLGVFGLLAYGLLIAAIINMCLKTIRVKDAYKGLSTVISAALVTSLLTMLFTYASFQSTFITFVLLSLLTAESALNTNKAWSKLTTISLESKTHGEGGILVESQMIYKQEILQYVISLPIVALAAFGMYQVYLQYAPEFFVRKAVIAASRQEVNDAYDYQVRALSVNAQRSEYHRLYANTNLALAQSLSAKQDLSDQEKTAAQNLLAQALRNIKFATENLNPLDSANWEVRARIYRFLIPAAKDADQFAIQAYNTAIQLDPTNPVLRVELGGVYFGKEDYLSAGNLFKQAVNLKSDYANARYNLAHSLLKLKAYSDAKTEFEAVQSLVEKGSSDYNAVASDLETVNKELAQVAGAQAENKPSVEAIEKAGEAKKETPAPQEPLTKPGERGPDAD